MRRTVVHAVLFILFVSLSATLRSIIFPAQITAYMPATFPGNWTFTDYRLLTLFGVQLNILQILPILYVLLTALLIFILRFSYKRVQIGGR